MPSVVVISGSPSERSRSSALLQGLIPRLETIGVRYQEVVVRQLPAEALLHARIDEPDIKEAIGRVHDADAVIIGCPVYKASFPGLLKVFFDLLPSDALADRVVLPIMTGGTIAHLLAIDYALKPVLSALGSTTILKGVFVQDADISWGSDGSIALAESVEQRLQQSIHQLVIQITKPYRFQEAIVGGKV